MYGWFPLTDVPVDSLGAATAAAEIPPPTPIEDEDEPRNPLHESMIGNCTASTVSPGQLDASKRAELTKAAVKASKLYPGPVGQLVSQELVDYGRYGFRFEMTSFSEQLLRHILDADLEEAPSA